MKLYAGFTFHTVYSLSSLKSSALLGLLVSHFWLHLCSALVAFLVMRFDITNICCQLCPSGDVSWAVGGAAAVISV